MTRLIQMNGRDIRFLIGRSSAEDALAINEAATAKLLFSAAAQHVATIQALTAPLSYVGDEAAREIPGHVFIDFIDSIHGIAVMAGSLMQHAAVQQHDEERGQSSAPKGAA